MGKANQEYNIHYNTSVKNLYANGMHGHLVRSAVEHMKSCVQCNEQMFPEHLSQTETTAISNGKKPTLSQMGHLLHCTKCKEASIRNYNSIFELILDEIKQIPSRLFRRKKQNS